MQAERRRREHARRLAIARTVDDTRQRFGLARRRIAESIEISERTLRDWRRNLRQGRGGAIRGRGRPTFTCDVETRNGVIRFLHHVTGPVVGLPALRALFGQVPRCVLANLLTRYRRAWRRRYCPWGKRLVWHVPGSVWAMDFSKASYRIDGVDWYIFAVRDLGSSHQLAWQAVASERAEEVIPILRKLFQDHGAPLVLKSDNGSAFVAEAMREAMREDQVVQLFSPAGRPSYNGGLERSNSVNKMYTARHAMSAGHEYQWLSSDLEAARRVANETTRPWGHEGPTPQEAWDGRDPLSDEQRAELLGTLAEQRAHSAELLGIDLSRTLDHADLSQLDRHAVQQVLTRLGYLSLRRGKRVTKKPKRVKSEDIKRRISREATESSDSPSVVASRLPPLMNHRPCVDNARRGGGTSRPPRDPPAPPSRPAQSGSSPARVEPPQATATRRARTSRADERPGVGNAARAGVAREQMLAPPVQSITMRADNVAAPSTGSDVANATAARRERPLTSWWRRLVTPLVSTLKAAINTG